MKRIISIGGGGMKTFVSCAVLAEIERRQGKPITQLFDLGAGTSGGGIILMSLASGHTAQETLNFFTADGPNIFKTGLLSGTFGILTRGYRFDPAALQAALQSRFGAATIASALMPCIVPAVDRVTQKTIFFKSFDPGTSGYAMWQAAMGTSAAQTYFPPFALNQWSLDDGGNAANNPSMCAYADAVKLWGNGEDYRVLSLGCGEDPGGAVKANPGIISILEETLSLMLDCNDELPDYQLSQIIGGEFFNIQAQGITTGLADASPAALASLQAVAKATIAVYSEELDEFFK